MLDNQDQLLGVRLEKLENGVIQLDNRVSQLDNKVGIVIQQNAEFMIQHSENFRDIRSSLEEHRSDMKKSIRHIRSQTSSRWQLIGIGSGLATWTFFMIWVMWG